MMLAERGAETARRLVETILTNRRVRFEAWLLERDGQSILWVLLPDDDPEAQLEVFRGAIQIDPAAVVDLRVTDARGEVARTARRVGLR